MSALPALESVLRRTDTRRRWLRARDGGWNGLLVAAVVGVFWVGAWKMTLVPGSTLQYLWVVALVALAAGMLVGGWRKFGPLATARWLDEKQNLQQRLSTALDLSSRPGSASAPGYSAWRQLVDKDAEAAAGQVNLKTLLPSRLPKMALWSVAGWALVAGIFFLPIYQTATQRQAKKNQVFIREAGRELAGLVKRQIEQRPPVMDAPKKALADVGDLGMRLSTVKLNREDALKDLAKVTDTVNREAAELQRNPMLKKMAEAARSSDKGSEAGGSTLQKKMEEMSRQLGEMASHPDAAESLKKDLEKLQDQAKGLSGDNSPAAAAQREKLSQQASQLAKQAAAMGAPLPSLEAAAQALSAAQVENFLKDLKVAEQDLNKMAAMAQSLSEMRKQAETMGKDLAEQLKNGQVEAAIQSLEAMRKDLAAGKLSPDLVDKIAKALPPSKPYGKVQDQLQKALSQMKEGKPGESEASLASAQKELKELMDQMGDAQAMEAALASLQQAQMSIGNSMLWSECTKPGGTPGTGKGAKGGKGVGTWASSSAWSLPDQIDDLWDNSSNQRPDQAGKGQTDRDNNLPGGLVPTKIKGEMQPGGAMPSVTIKGLSLKGTSHVNYSEAVAAAQVDAQAALSQEQVPKAYQNSVRDYFDDLKK